MAERRLPSGTVTFLFTDIEGSTRLWEGDRAAMAVALARHDALLAAAIAGSGGVVFKTVGDAFCAAFASAPAAVSAALAGQRALAGEPWGALGPLRARMALHTGSIEAREDDYFGPPLNRVARLLATGYGGQVLLSGSTEGLVRGHLAADVALRDLGEHRLRDLLEPEHVYQLVAPDLLDRFPPLKSLELHPTNLPAQPTPLVGRDGVLADVAALLGRDDVQLVTLTGMGGTGKTRLGLQVAAELLERFPDGAFVVDLAPLTDHDLVLPAIAAALGVREAGGQPLRETLNAYLAGKRLLLLLDNFEQVLPAAPEVADLLGTCSRLKILVTSRARLGLRAEYEFLVPPLATPDPARLPPLADLAKVDAVALFTQRAAAARHDFALTEANAAAVAAICARLDGLPLAIELAAARVTTLPPKAILERLTNRLKLLTGGARDLPARQRTLRAAIDWSHSLLAAEEQVLFRRLAIFAGGFDLEAAEAVVPAVDELDVHLDADVLDGVATLVDQSLLRQAEGADGEARFTMLETLREFGLERLAATAELGAAREAHAAWCLELAETAQPHLTGPEQGAWLARLETEHDNLRAVLFDGDDDGDGERNLRLAAALWRFWYTRGHLSEGRAALEGALVADGASSPMTAARATALGGGGFLAYLQGDYARAVALQEESLAIRQALGDKAGVASSQYNLGLVVEARGDFAGATALYEDSLAIARAANDKRRIAAALHKLGTIADEQGDYAHATTLYEESLGLLRGLGDQRSVAVVLNTLGLVAQEQGDHDRAVDLYTESLTVERALGDQRSVAISLNNLGLVAYEQGDYDRATGLHTESLEIEQELGSKRGVAASLNNLALVAHAQGDDAKAATLQAESLAILRDLGDKNGLIVGLEDTAAIAASVARAEPAARLFGAAAALREALGVPQTPAERARNERTLADARAGLDEGALAETLACGRAQGVDEAVAEALLVLQDAAATRPPR